MKHSRSGERSRRGARPIAVTVVLRCLAFCLVLTGGIVAVLWDSHPRVPVVDLSDTSTGFTAFGGSATGATPSRAPRLIYPYSIVPGGVASAQELREAAAHDPLVAAHYAGFDYSRAHVIEVKRPELVYLSYRRGKHVYWTSKQASLHVGEKLLTDGRITARTRCGNQVSVLPQANVGPNEPTMAELDRPDAVASGMARNFPSNSDFLSVDPALPIGQDAPGHGFFGPPGVFMPPPIGGGGSPNTSTVNGCPPDQNGSTSNCGSQNPPPPPVVPEPATVILFSSGVAAILTRLRFTRR